jgi:hypothetical protein
MMGAKSRAWRGHRATGKRLPAPQTPRDLFGIWNFGFPAQRARDFALGAALPTPPFAVRNTGQRKNAPLERNVLPNRLITAPTGPNGRARGRRRRTAALGSGPPRPERTPTAFHTISRCEVAAAIRYSLE